MALAMITQIERMVQTAKLLAPLRLMRQKRRHITSWHRVSINYLARLRQTQRDFSQAEILEEATRTTMEFGNLTSHSALYLLREMEMTQGYRELGFSNLREWAYARLAYAKERDTLSRLCTAVLSLIAPLDASPVITPDGEKINGLALLSQSKASSMIKVAGMYANSEREQQQAIVNGLLTLGSNSRAIKEDAGWTPRMGKATAVFTELDEVDEQGNPMVDIHIRATYAQSKVIEGTNAWMLNIQFTGNPM